MRVPPPNIDPGYGKVRSACSVEGLSEDAGPSVGDQGRCIDRQVLASSPVQEVQKVPVALLQKTGHSVHAK